MTKKTDSRQISPIQKALLEALRYFLVGEKNGDVTVTDEVISLAETHSVLPLVCEAVFDEKASVSHKVYERIERQVSQTVNQSYRLFFETCRVVKALEDAGIMVTVLKGVAAASFYPVLEYRKSGDIDILVNDLSQTAEAEEVLKGLGYWVSGIQDALHQIVMVNARGIEIELHIMLSEPFDNARINDFLSSLFEDIRKHRIYKEILSFPIPILDDDYQAFELLIHMLQHFLRRGFGIKLLCDWVVYWNEFVTKKGGTVKRYQEMIKQCGIAGFSDMVSAVCYQELGLCEEAYVLLTEGQKERRIRKETAEEFLLDILEGGEFGDVDKGRMVVLRNTSLKAYVIEFHHQMHLNFPKAGKYPLLWPALWIVTLCRFLRNNRKVRGMSSQVFFKKAKSRSRIAKAMKLWEYK